MTDAVLDNMPFLCTWLKQIGLLLIMPRSCFGCENDIWLQLCMPLFGTFVNIFDTAVGYNDYPSLQ